MQFVNIHGDPVSLAPVSIKRETRKKEAHHDGWFVTGVPPNVVKDAQSRHGFSMDWFLRNTKRVKVAPKGYSSPGPAQALADMARKAGWLDIQIVEKKVD